MFSQHSEEMSNQAQKLIDLQSQHQEAMKLAHAELQECTRRNSQLQDEHRKSELEALEEAAEAETTLVSEYESMISSLRSEHESAQRAAEDRHKQQDPSQ